MTREALMRTLSISLLLVVTVSCGGGRQLPSTPSFNPASPAIVAGRALPVETTLEATLADLDALAAPAGVDPSVFAQIKSMFREALTARGVSKLVSAAPTGTANSVDDMTLTDNGDGTSTLTWGYKNIGDYDQNSEVNLGDLVPIAVYFKETSTGPNWSTASVADGDGNGEVNLGDIVPIAANFLSTVAGYYVYESRLFEGILPEHADVDFNTSHSASQVGGKRIFDCRLPVSDANHTWVVPIAPGEILGTPSDIMPITAGGADSTSTIKVSSALEQLDDSVVAQITVSSDETTLSIPKTAISAEQVQPGKILVSSAGQGFLKKVISVTDAGSTYEVTVEQAAVEDMFKRAVIYFYRDIKPEDVERVISQLPGVRMTSATSKFEFTLSRIVMWDKDKNPVTSNDQITADGTLAVNNPRFEFKLDIDNFLGMPTGVREFRLVLTATIDADMDVSAAVDLPLLDQKLRLIVWGLVPFDINLGFIRLSLGPELSLNVGLTAGASFHYGAGIDASVTTSVGVNYYNGWTTVQSFEKSFSCSEPQFYGQAEVKAYFGPEFNINILGARLAYIEAYPYAKMEVDTHASPWWEIKGGIEANLGVDVNILSKALLQVKYVIPIWEGTIAEAYPPTPQPVVNLVEPTSGKIGESVTFVATVSGPPPYTSHIWDFGGGATPNTSSEVLPTVTLTSTPGQYIGTVTVSNVFGTSQPYQFVLTVSATANTPPAAGLTANPPSGSAPLLVNFNASSSVDPDGSITKYEWDWNGDGTYDLNSGTNPTVQHTYGSSGIYSATVRVTDNGVPGLTDTESVTITVGAPPTPEISVSPLSLSETLPPNGTGSKQFTISNYGTANLTWGVSDDRNWMNCAPTGGTTIPGTSDPVTVSFTAPSTPGVYNGTITVTSNDPDEPSVQVAVTLTVTAPPQPPDPPTNTQASDGTYTTKIRVSWTASPGATRYDVYRATSQGGIYNYIGQTNVSPYDDFVGDTNVYWYKVKAHNDNGDSGFSNADSGYKGSVPQPPDPPANLWASDGTHTDMVQVGWDESAGATIYYVYRSTSQGGAYDYIGQIPTPPYNDNPPSTDVYWYKAKAHNDNGDSDFSNADSGYKGTSGSQWYIYVADVYDVRYLSLAMVDGNPAISGSRSYQLIYVRANDANGTTWPTPVVVEEGSMPRYTVLLVVDGRPAIIYQDYMAYQLKYVRANDVDGTSWGTPVVIDTGLNQLAYVSGCIVNGNPAASYYKRSNSWSAGELTYVRANDVDGTSWGSPRTVDGNRNGNQDTGHFTSLAVVNGNPAISYRYVRDGDLRFVRANNADGSSWGSPLTIDSVGDQGLYTSLEVVAGNPAITYTGDATNHLKYVRATNANGSSWGSPVILSTTDGGYDSLAIIGGMPAASYYGLYYVAANDNTGSSWGSPTMVDSGGGDHTSLALVNGHPGIAYHGSGQLRFAICY